MVRKRSKNWKLERASVHVHGKPRPRSNKYSHSDQHKKPASGTRARFWVGSYTRSDGIHVRGHYRKATKTHN